MAVAVGLALLFTLFLSASGIARLYTDWLWFSSIERSSVWQTLISTQITLAVTFTVLFFALLWTNLYLADRLAPPLRLEGPEDDLIERYHQLVGPHAGKLRIAVSAFFAGFAGLQTGRQWEAWLLFRNGGDFGFTDPLFDRDAGFYVFRLPFWTFLIDWFFAALVFALILSTIAHYMNGGIRAASATNRVSPGVKLHLSALLAVLALLRAGAYYFDRFELLTDTRGEYTGALATDVEIQLPALNLLALVSLFGAGLILFNIRRKGFGLPLAAIGIWMVAHIVVGGIFPSLYQRLRVEPQLSSQEAPFIARNIEATRFAYGLDDASLERNSFDYEGPVTGDDISSNDEVFSRVQLLDPALVDETVTKDEAQRKEYRFSDPLDTGRYEIDGEIQPVVVAARDLNLSQADSGWENQHLAFTHGYGVVMALANETVGSAPRYLIQGIGPNLRIAEGLDLELERPQLYFSEEFGGFAIVGARRDEIDFPGSSGADGSALTRYEGEGGVPMGSLIRRLAFSLRFQDLSVLISGEVTSESKIIFNRDIVDRVRTVAPFLELDSDPYPVVAGGRIQWVVDAYTTTGRFPYSQGNRVRSLDAGADLASNFNYVRNSVKAVIDSYDGDITLYVVDDTDPLVEAYEKSFPALFTPASEAPDEISRHFKYPVDLFKVQTEMFATYHVDEPRQFLQGDLSWRVASEPLVTSEGDARPVQASMRPQYRLTKLPESDTFEYVLQRAFVPSSGADTASDRPELTSVLIGRSDGEAAGKLMLYELPNGQVAAPDLVDANIRKSPPISQYITPLDLQGSNVLWGEMQLVLTDSSVVYVRPLYVAGTGGTTNVPELTQIVAVSGERISMAPTLEEALAGITSATPGTTAPPVAGTPLDSNGDEPEPEPAPEVPVVPEDLADRSAAELLGLAAELLDAAERLQDQDPTAAAALRADAQAALDQLARLLGVEPTSIVVAGPGEA